MTGDALSPGLTVLERIDDRCAAFEAALLDGDAPDPDDYLTGFTRDDRTGLLYELLRVWWEHEPPTAEQRADVRRRFPDDRDVIDRALQDARTVTVPPDSAPEPQPARVRRNFGRYRIRERLGAGGMGSVHVARDTELGRLVALKLPQLGRGNRSALLRRFRQEARTASAVRHPNLCTVLDYGEVDGVPFIVMPYIVGTPLSEVLAGGGMVPERQAAAFIRRLAEALDEAHVAGIVHRDLKPANIVIDEQRQPIVVDFGLAFDVEVGAERLTRTGEMLGTPAYMPPEQVLGDLTVIGPRSDVYSLGVVLYEMLAGRRPFIGPVRSILARIRNEEPDPPSKYRRSLDRRIEEICLVAMARSPDDRYGSMAEFADRLREYLLESRPANVPLPQQDRENERELSRFLNWARPDREQTVGVLRVAVAVALVAIIGLGAFLAAARFSRTASRDSDVGDEVAAVEPRIEEAPDVPDIADPGPDDPAPAPIDGPLPVEPIANAGEGEGGDPEPAILIEPVATDHRIPLPVPDVLADVEMAPQTSGPTGSDTSGLPRALIGTLVKPVRMLDLSDPEILDGNVRSRLSTNPNVVVLLLEGSAITDDGLQPVGRLADLRHLDLGHTAITDQGVAHLTGLSGLRVLQLHHTQMTSNALASVDNLGTLEWLELADTKVGDVGLTRMLGPRIRTLGLGGTNVTDVGLAFLDTFENLENLQLCGTSVTGPGLSRHRAKLGRLRNLWISADRISMDDIARLQAAIPDCTIHLR